MQSGLCRPSNTSRWQRDPWEHPSASVPKKFWDGRSPTQGILRNGSRATGKGEGGKQSGPRR
eukprot:6240299-Pyramimonas_sp.AAC.1